MKLLLIHSILLDFYIDIFFRTHILKLYECILHIKTKADRNCSNCTKKYLFEMLHFL